MQKVTIDQVKKSYNGASGCMCGCNGEYSLKSADDIPAANKACGYEGYDEKSVRPRAVAIAVSKVNKAIEEFDAMATPEAHNPGCRVYKGLDEEGRQVWYGITDEWVSIERNDRNTTVYLED